MKFGVNDITKVMFGSSQVTKAMFNGVDLLNSDYAPNRILAWEDDFETLNTNVWEYELGLVRPGNSEIQYYTSEAKNVFIQDSILHLKAIKDNPYTGFDWSSGSIVSRKGFAFGLGLIEAKIKYDRQDGCWPAFWTLGRHFWEDYNTLTKIGQAWPDCGEIDIVEFWPSNYIYPGTFFKNESTNQNGHEIAVNVAHTWDNEFHIYGLERTVTELKFYVDRVLIGTLPKGQFQDELYTAHQVLFNLAMGGIGGTVSPLLEQTEYQVDWLRYYLPDGATSLINPTVMTLDCGATFGLNTGKRLLVNTVYNVDYPPNYGCSWESSNSSVATCIGGVVKSLSNGTTTITATSPLGLVATCELTVDASVVNLTQSIDLYTASASIGYGETTTILAVALPEYRSNTGVTWQSSDTGVATVTDGVVTAVGASGGTVTITCTSADGNASDTIQIVCNAQVVDGLMLNIDAALATGSGLPTNSPFLTTWTDLTGDNDGTLINMAGTEASGWVPSDPSLCFDGSNDYVSFPIDGSNFPTSSFSVCMNFVVGSLIGGQTCRIAGIDRANGAYGTFVIQFTKSNKFLFYVMNSVSSAFHADSDNNVVDGQEYEIVCTFNGTSKVLNMYIDKVLQAVHPTLTGTRDTAVSNLVLGASYSNHTIGGSLKGKIKKFRLYNKALSQEEVTALWT